MVNVDELTQYTTEDGDIKFEAYSSIELKEDENGEFERTGDGKLIVSGYSVHTGLYHGGLIEIPASELSNIAETLKGQQLRKNHSPFTEDVVGRVTDTRTALDKNIGKRGVRFKGVVRDKQLDQQITDRFIDNNSIGFTLFPECSKCGEDFRRCEHRFSEAHVVARDCQCYEQSFVTRGADGNTTIEPGAKFVEKANNDFKMQFKQKKETDFMGEGHTESDTQVPPVSVTFNTMEPKREGEEEMSDEMKDLKAKFEKLQNEKNELEGKLSEKDNEINELSQEKSDLEQEKSDLEGEKTALATKQNETEGKLQKYITAEEEEARLAKEKLCQEIAELRVKAGKLEQEKVEEKVTELFEKYDEDALTEIKESIIIPETSEEDEPGRFHSQENGAQSMPDGEEEEFFDLGEKKLSGEKKEVRDKYYMAMINSAKR